MRGNSNICRHGNFGAAAERMPVQGSDDGSGELCDAVTDRPHPPGHVRRLFQRPKFGQFLEIATGDKRTITSAGDHQGAGPANRVECLVQLVHRFRRDGIACLWTVDGDDRQLAVHFNDNQDVLRYDIGILVL